MEKYINMLSARGFLTIVIIIVLAGFILAGASGMLFDFIAELIKNI